MNIRPLTRLFLSAAASVSALAIGSAAMAQAIAPGTQVVDPSGGSVGLVTKVSGDLLTVRTDRHEVQLPAGSFTPSEGKLLFAMTRDQLNSETDKALAQAEAAVTVGAEVRGRGGEVVGTISELDEDIVTLKMTSGDLIRLPRNAIGGSAQGAVLGVTAAELQVMAAEAKAQ